MTGSEVMALIKASDKRFYVYVLHRPSGVPFYVGCGSGRRVFDHVIHAKKGKGSLRHRIIREIRASGSAVDYRIAGWFHDRDEAERFEIDLIRKLGRSDLELGPLANASDGGRGGKNLSPAVVEAKRQALIESWKTRDRSVLEAMHTPEAREKARMALVGRKRGTYKPRDSSWITDEMRAKRSAFLKSDPVSRRPGVAAKISAAKRGKKQPNHWTKDRSKVWTRGKHPRAQTVEIDGRTFECIMDAADAYGVSRNTIARWVANPDAPRGRWPK